MKELTVTPLLACALLASPMAATAGTMSCFVATPLDRDPEFTTPGCSAVIPCGARTAGAVFRVDPPLPNNFKVLWSDTSCDRTESECTVVMTRQTKKMEATVLNLDNSRYFEVRATAAFDNESSCPSPR